MKLSVTQENLSKALSTVSRVANTSTTLPVLANILIKTVNNQLQLAATNLDLAISQLIGGKIEKEGSITVPSKIMTEFISNLPSGVIELELKDNKLHITAEKYDSIINGVSAEEFPVMPSINGGKNWTIDKKILKQALSQTILAAGNDESRPVLTGVQIKNQDGVIFIAATDSYRLAEKKLSKSKNDVDLLIPASSLKDLFRILDGTEGQEVNIIYDEQQALFEIDSVTLVTRLIDGKYPDYKKLIPQTFDVTANLAKSELMNITKVSSLFARESAGSITISLDEKTNQISIKSIASQLGENTSDADANCKGSGQITINSRYLIEALGIIEGDSVTLGFNGKLEPVVLTDDTNDDYLHIIMPLKS